MVKRALSALYLKEEVEAMVDQLSHEVFRIAGGGAEG